MKDKVIKEIIKKKVSKLSELGSNISKDFGQEDIHDLRTTAKSLRSFLRLLHTHIHKKGVKLPKEFKELYRIAGVIREAQLEIESLNTKNLSFPCYIESVQQIIPTQKQEWMKCFDEKIFEKLESKLCSYQYGPLPPAVLNDFFKEKMDGLTRLSTNASPTDDEIHEARKQVKDILYNAKIAQNHWHAADGLLQKTPLESLDQLANAIGDYHDDRVILDHISAFSSPAMQPDEINNISDYSEEEAARLMEEKASVLSMVKEFVIENAA